MATIRIKFKIRIRIKMSRSVFEMNLQQRMCFPGYTKDEILCQPYCQGLENIYPWGHRQKQSWVKMFNKCIPTLT